MSLQSMTGFARATVERGGTFATWELRSLNGKGLDLRLRLPPGLDRIDQTVRQAAQKRFSRGNIQAVLTLSGAATQVQPVVNETFLQDVAELARRLQDQYGLAPASADGVLALRGVLELPDQGDDEETRGLVDAAISEAFEAALGELESVRRTEGAALRELMLGHLARIEQLAAQAEADPSRETEAIRKRLGDQVRLLMESGAAMDEARLHQEAAFLAAKADIREEIDRLRTHVEAARVLLAGGGAVGRKLDFLSQEFNREANTLCSKSNAATVTAIGLDLKAVVDQFREQVQNLE
ncbi:YicC family protein [Chelativorans sp. ZYF759]|uniref:YicC/YloC family endoribonuclease n=1 Tax=Chelativorans sp. ZYF759 TaxID=2692213 RepID=UPI00145D42CA|nr:YicC/YloC family endoribonuclease [Chelativorans sp. ZYF759]NMG41547.1 YicC family protein [Chelativorans sp. ZYF759]